MKTCLFAPCYLDGKDAYGVDRLARVQYWVEYHLAIKEQLGFSSIVLSDASSSAERLAEFTAWVRSRSLDIWVVEPSVKLKGGVGSVVNYPYCWIALYVMRKAMDDLGFEKAITIDTDGFVLTKRLADYVRNLNDGWTAFWVKKYNFPSAEFHVLCPGQGREQFNEFTTPHYMAHQGKLMETALPFTRVEKRFNTDRYGEDGVLQSAEMDFYSQYAGNVKLYYQGAV